ncbi:hypothetical protein [Cypionkella sp.]|uniref:hypothetical protein n=1 Tax=Cypionkella sp. TaxID=2811411 RepID=UPI002720631D|nr:hypothetical protein [Cypionkella sp.]MDO8982373.1 hypothetical protein [Cypionkella sp.]MDP2050623.1 hypothetical protein [Cypionkella sp.]
MKILFVGIQYHAYTRAIIDEMRLLGAEVTYVDIQPRSVAQKVLRTLARPLYERSVERHLRAAVDAARGVTYDKVVFLQVHQMDLATLAALRQSQPQAEFTLYNWDAITTHDYRAHTAQFDRVLTFDRRDAAAHGFGYLPLFCIRPWQGLGHGAQQSVYMVGNIVRLGRYHAVGAFRDYCARHGVAFRQHLKISPVVLLHMLRARIWPRGVTLRSIPEPEFRAMIAASAAAFDFANHSQSGQTMRMMESLCAGKKIITNNDWVRQEPFYTPDRIHVFQDLDFSGIDAFLKVPLADPEARFPEYQVQSFARRLIGLDPVLSLGGGHD